MATIHDGREAFASPSTEDEQVKADKLSSVLHRDS